MQRVTRAGPQSRGIVMNRALLVGINSYPTAPLQGCVDDVQDMAGFLVESCGFLDSDIRLLVDARATTDAIRERLTWLVSGVRPGDRVLFHYSGHGTVLPLRGPSGAITEGRRLWRHGTSGTAHLPPPPTP